MLNVLVLCTGNSCRSQMAEGFLRKMLGENAKVFSAGIETHGVNPRAIKSMEEKCIDISMHTSNHVDEYIDIPFDVVLTVCDNANEKCPVFPSRAKKFHYNFPDPAKATGTEEEIMKQFANTRDLIQVYCEKMVKEIS
ncbi:MAG: arsenate reductase ArsC [Bacteroidetes bacterium]|nr:arsenate reductase ArsC [Bacteroidota bacterium]